MTTPARAFGLILVTVFTIAVGSSAAWADEPASPAWPTAAGRSTLDTLLLFGGATIGLIVVLSLFALLTARNNFTPAAPGNEIHTTSDRAPVGH